MDKSVAWHVICWPCVFQAHDWHLGKFICLNNATSPALKWSGVASRQMLEGVARAHAGRPLPNTDVTQGTKESLTERMSSGIRIVRGGGEDTVIGFLGNPR